MPGLLTRFDRTSCRRWLCVGHVETRFFAVVEARYRRCVEFLAIVTRRGAPAYEVHTPIVAIVAAPPCRAILLPVRSCGPIYTEKNQLKCS